MVMIATALSLRCRRRKNSRFRTYTPRAGEERDCGERTMGVEMSAPKKLSLQDLYPRHPGISEAQCSRETSTPG
jgi:hypothetical protein